MGKITVLLYLGIKSNTIGSAPTPESTPAKSTPDHAIIMSNENENDDVLVNESPGKKSFFVFRNKRQHNWVKLELNCLFRGSFRNPKRVYK